jgi:hypothetical protein
VFTTLVFGSNSILNDVGYAREYSERENETSEDAKGRESAARDVAKSVESTRLLGVLRTDDESSQCVLDFGEHHHRRFIHSR